MVLVFRPSLENGFVEYPALFTGVGKLKGFKLKLRINEDFTPVAQSVRRLPFELPDKVGEKLDQLLDMANIEKVSEATPKTWVSPQVVVSKADGKDIRVCVNIRWANEEIARERHPIPTLFGHELSARGIAPSEEKIAAVMNARPPQNVSELRSFVQLVQYSTKFIPDYAQVAEPLRRLLRKGKTLVCEPAHLDAFQKLKSS